MLLRRIPHLATTSVTRNLLWDPANIGLHGHFIVAFKPRKFVMAFTLGSLLFMAGFSVLQGPWNRASDSRSSSLHLTVMRQQT
jgi:hypothetical protein